MPDLPRNQLIGCAFGLAVVVLASWLLARRDQPGARSAAAAAPVRIARADDGDAGALVHVAGAVKRPGVYRLRAGARVDDAVRRAGGPARRADLDGLNLAAKVEDGRQVLVPLRQRAARPGGSGTAPVAAPAPGVPLNLNTATAEQLDELAGVGPATAAKILAYRQEHGGFGSVDELGRIPGIGERRLASLREQVRT